MGAEFWKFKRDKVVQGRDKPILVDTGFTVMFGVGSNGKPYMKLIDDRSGNEWWGFKQEPRQKPQGTSYPQGANAPPPHMPGQPYDGPQGVPDPQGSDDPAYGHYPDSDDDVPFR